MRRGEKGCEKEVPWASGLGRRLSRTMVAPQLLVLAFHPLHLLELSLDTRVPVGAQAKG